jgi:hypothetical protein
MLDRPVGLKRADVHNDQCRCPKCIETAIDEITIRNRASSIYGEIQKITKKAYTELDASHLSNRTKANVYCLAMGWTIRWLAQTAPLDGEPFGAKINNIT